MRVIRCFARQVAKRFDSEKIVLFGSYAPGQPHADSDMGILVVILREIMAKGTVHYDQADKGVGEKGGN